MDEGHFIHVSAQMRQQRRDPFSALAAWAELPRTFHEASVRPLERNEGFATWKRLSASLLQLGLVLESVHCRHRPRTKDLNHSFGSRSEMGLTCGRHILSQQALFVQQNGQSNAGKSLAHVVEELAATDPAREQRHCWVSNIHDDLVIQFFLKDLR